MSIQQKRILAVVSVIFSLIAIAGLICRFIPKKLNDRDFSIINGYPNSEDKNKLLSYLNQYGNSTIELRLTGFKDLKEEDLKKIISYCPNLTQLDLLNYNITNASLEHLKGLSALQSLHLWQCNQITDAGLEHLKRLSALQSLNLYGLLK